MLLFTDEVQIKFSPVLIGGTMHQTSVFSIRKHCELKNVCVHLEIESIKLRTWDNTVRHCVAASKVMLLYTDEVWINLLPILISGMRQTSVFSIPILCEFITCVCTFGDRKHLVESMT